MVDWEVKYKMLLMKYDNLVEEYSALCRELKEAQHELSKANTRIKNELEQRSESTELFQKNEIKEPMLQDMCTCPRCGTYNEIIKKRRNTVEIDVVYCWHCGQAISVKQIN